MTLKDTNTADIAVRKDFLMNCWFVSLWSWTLLSPWTFFCVEFTSLVKYLSSCQDNHLSLLKRKSNSENNILLSHLGIAFLLFSHYYVIVAVGYLLLSTIKREYVKWIRQWIIVKLIASMSNDPIKSVHIHDDPTLDKPHDTIRTYYLIPSSRRCRKLKLMTWLTHPKRNLWKSSITTQYF